MRNFILALMICAIPTLAFAGSVNEALFTNITGTETLSNNSKPIKCYESVNIYVSMGNYSGSVALQASLDGGTTFVTYTTQPQGSGNTVYIFPDGLVATDIKAVPTDTYTGGARSGVSARISYRECD